MATTNKAVDNGVNVGALLGAREVLSKAPEAAKFQWRATCILRFASEDKLKLATNVDGSVYLHRHYRMPAESRAGVRGARGGMPGLR